MRRQSRRGFIPISVSLLPASACNIWDAHNRAGITQTSVIITITEDRIVIPDFDSGITPDMMGPLCGAYGGADNGEETGPV